MRYADAKIGMRVKVQMQGTNSRWKMGEWRPGTIVGFPKQTWLLKVQMDGNKNPSFPFTQFVEPLDENADFLQRGREQVESRNNPPGQSQPDAHVLGLVGKGGQADPPVQERNYGEEAISKAAWEEYERDTVAEHDNWETP